MMPNSDTQLKTFISYLDKFDREGTVAYALSLLKDGDINIPILYEQVLAPALNRIVIPRCDETCMIWKEHMMSHIVRTTMEAVYPYILQEREKAGNKNRNKLVVLASPQEEYHEIGIRMGSDFFTMLGYDVAYIGCNTPKDTLLDAVKTMKPEIVCISVTNYLNLAQLPTLVGELKKMSPTPAVYLSGSALKHTGKQAEDFGADGILTSYASVKALSEGASL